jgi:hypothetical protein
MCWSLPLCHEFGVPCADVQWSLDVSYHALNVFPSSFRHDVCEGSSRDRHGLRPAYSEAVQSVKLYRLKSPKGTAVRKGPS